MCGRCSSLPFALLLITNSNYTARQTDRLTDKGGTAVWLVLAKGQPAENRCRTVSQSQKLPQSKGNRRARLATDRQTDRLQTIVCCTFHYNAIVFKSYYKA